MKTSNNIRIFQEREATPILEMFLFMDTISTNNNILRKNINLKMILVTNTISMTNNIIKKIISYSTTQGIIIS